MIFKMIRGGNHKHRTFYKQQQQSYENKTPSWVEVKLFMNYIQNQNSVHLLLNNVLPLTAIVLSKEIWALGPSWRNHFTRVSLVEIWVVPSHRLLWLQNPLFLRAEHGWTNGSLKDSSWLCGFRWYKLQNSRALDPLFCKAREGLAIYPLLSFPTLALYDVPTWYWNNCITMKRLWFPPWKVHN